MKIIALKIQGDDDYAVYYETTDEVASSLYDLQFEFDKWLKNIEGNHPFRIYNETIESNGEVSSAGYINTHTFDDFIGWVNVEKYNKQVAVKIKNCPYMEPTATIYF